MTTTVGDVVRANAKKGVGATAMGDDEVRGLSAAELATETLFPGDTIEYYSMMYVAGDKRGHRLSKVLRIDKGHEEFPIRVDTLEMLPLIIMLKRKRDRFGHAIPNSDAKWRKLRTFRLVNGEVEGETRADRLNAGLKKSVDSAFASVRKQLKANNAQAKSRSIMQNFLAPKTSAPAKEASDDDFDGASPAQKKKKKKTSKYFSDARSPVKRVPLGNAADADLNKRYPSTDPQSPERDVAFKQKRRVIVGKQREHVTRTPSPRRSAQRDRIVEREGESRKNLKRKRLDFMNETSPNSRFDHRSLVDDAELDSDGADTRTVELTPSSQSSEKRRKKKKNKMLVNYIDQIEEKMSSTKLSLDAYLELDKTKQHATDVLKRQISTNSASKDQPARVLQLNKNTAGGTTWSSAREHYREDKSKNNPLAQALSWLKPRSTANSGSPSRKQRDRTVVCSPATDTKLQPAGTALARMRMEVFNNDDVNDSSEPRSKGPALVPVERRNALMEMAHEVFDTEPIPRVKIAGLRRPTNKSGAPITRLKESGNKETPKRSQKVIDHSMGGWVDCLCQY